jgi:hypothetical protein
MNFNILESEILFLDTNILELTGEMEVFSSSYFFFQNNC